MVNVFVEENCNNAPKKQFVKDFLIASATSDLEAAANMLADSVTLEVVGQETISEKESVIRALFENKTRRGVSEMTVRNILSHGNKCAADGVLSYKDDGEVAFCGIYTFTSHSKDAKIKKITTYSIEKEPELK